jgi:hypothetical protein
MQRLLTIALALWGTACWVFWFLIDVLGNWRTLLVIVLAVWATIITYHIGFLFWTLVWLGLFIGMVSLLVVPIATHIRIRTETYPKAED